MVLLLRKLYLYFTKDPWVPLFSRGGGAGDVNFFPGVQMLISLETHVMYVLVIFKGGLGPDPLSPSGSANGQCHQHRTIFITVPLLTIIVRH